MFKKMPGAAARDSAVYALNAAADSLSDTDLSDVALWLESLRDPEDDLDDPRPVVTGEGQKLFRVAVVVFANARASDFSGAGHAVSRAVERACWGAVPAGSRSLLFCQEDQRTRWRVPVEVAEVLELSVAMGNGYVGAMALDKPYRYAGMDSGGMPESLIHGRSRSDDD